MPEIKTRTVLVDGIPVDTTDAGATVIETLLRKLGDSTALATKASADLATLTASSTASLAAKDAELVTLKAQLADATSPAKLDARVKDRAEMISKAKALLPAVVVDGKTDDEIRAQVVDAKIEAIHRTGWTADQYKVAFSTLAANVKAADVADTLRDAIRGGATVANIADSRKAIEASDAATRDAWKGSQAATA